MDLLPAIDATPWLLPTVAASTLLGLVASGPVGRVLRCSRSLAVMLVVAVGLLLGATVTPGLGETYSLGTCLAGVDGELAELGWFRADVARNILLTFPLGVVVGLLRPPRRRPVAVGTVLLLPGVELAQLLLPRLGRACQITDMVANEVGLLAGLLLGATVGGLVAAADRRSRVRR